AIVPSDLSSGSWGGRTSLWQSAYFALVFLDTAAPVIYEMTPTHEDPCSQMAVPHRSPPPCSASPRPNLLSPRTPFDGFQLALPSWQSRRPKAGFPLRHRPGARQSLALRRALRGALRRSRLDRRQPPARLGRRTSLR